MEKRANLPDSGGAQGLLFEEIEASVRPTVGLATVIAQRLRGLLTGRLGTLRNQSDGPVPVIYNLFSFGRTVRLLGQMESWMCAPLPEDLVDDTDWVSIARILENWEVCSIGTQDALLGIETYLLVPEKEELASEDDPEAESLENFEGDGEHPALAIVADDLDMADWADFQRAWARLRQSQKEHLLDLLVPDMAGQPEAIRFRAHLRLDEFVYAYVGEYLGRCPFDDALQYLAGASFSDHSHI